MFQLESWKPSHQGVLWKIVSVGGQCLVGCWLQAVNRLQQRFCRGALSRCRLTGSVWTVVAVYSTEYDGDFITRNPVVTDLSTESRTCEHEVGGVFFQGWRGGELVRVNPFVLIGCRVPRYLS